MVFEQMQRIVAQQLSVSEEAVTLSATFKEDLGADSLDVVELIMAIEEEFGVDVPDQAAEGFVTVGDAVSYVEKNK